MLAEQKEQRRVVAMPTASRLVADRGGLKRCIREEPVLGLIDIGGPGDPCRFATLPPEPNPT